LIAVQPGTVMTVEKMGPAVATRRAFFMRREVRQADPGTLYHRISGP
jgi:hypothetical protein